MKDKTKASKKELYNQPTKKEKNWVVLLVIVVIIILVASIILNLTSKRTEVAPKNSWNNIVPGFSFSIEQQKSLGEPVDIEFTDSGSDYKYKTDFPTKSNTISVDLDNKVKFIKEYLTYDPEHTLHSYILESGDPDFSLFDPVGGSNVRAYVFLKDGLVVFAHNKDLSVKKKWYFEPTTQEKFMSSWGTELSVLEDSPEDFE